MRCGWWWLSTSAGVATSTARWVASSSGAHRPTSEWGRAESINTTRSPSRSIAVTSRHNSMPCRAASLNASTVLNRFFSWFPHTIVTGIGDSSIRVAACSQASGVEESTRSPLMNRCVAPQSTRSARARRAHRSGWCTLTPGSRSATGRPKLTEPRWRSLSVAMRTSSGPGGASVAMRWTRCDPPEPTIRIVTSEPGSHPSSVSAAGPSAPSMSTDRLRRPSLASARYRPRGRRLHVSCTLVVSTAKTSPRLIGALRRTPV